MKTSIIAAGAALLWRPLKAFSSSSAFPVGVVYTAANPGRWEKKAATHLPKVTVEGKKVTILTPHPMSEEHFIVRHTLVAADGAVLGEKTFSSADGKAASEFELPADLAGTVYATSFCNLHDFWLTEFTI